MVLKYMLETDEGLDDGVKALYTKGADGKLYLEVEGVVPKDKVDEFRNNNIELKKQLEKFKDVDPAKYQEAMKVLQKLDEKKLIEAGNFEEVVAQRVQALRQDFEAQVSDLTGKLSTSNRQLEALMVDATAKSAAIASGVLPTAIDDIILRAKTVFTVKDNVVVATENGQPMYDKDGTTPLTIDAWVKGLKKSAPHLFTMPAGGGAGGSGGSINPGNMTSLQKISAGLGS